MKATDAQLRLVTELIDAHEKTKQPMLAQRVILTARQHRILMEGWEATYPRGRYLETTKGKVHWSLVKQSSGYAIEYSPSPSPTQPYVPATPQPFIVDERAKRYHDWASAQHAKAQKKLTGEMWAYNNAREWVPGVKLQALVCTQAQEERVLAYWATLKVQNIECVTLEQQAEKELAHV